MPATDTMKQTAIVGQLEVMIGEIQWVIDRPHLQSIEDVNRLWNSINKSFRTLGEILNP